MIAEAPASADVVIVGGGVIGSATACFLTTTPAFQGRVLVIEKDPGYRSGATARSAGGIRQQFSTPENIAMSVFGAQFLARVGEHLAVEDEAPHLAFREQGYLLLATDSGVDVLRDNHALQRSLGADNVLLDQASLKRRFPWLAVDDLAAGCLGLSKEGWFDPFALLQGFRRKAQSCGAIYVADEAVGIDLAGEQVTAVRLQSGARIACGHLINAAGVQGARLAAMAGVEIPVHPRKRCVFVFDCRSDLGACPLVVDPSGLYFRPEGRSFIAGISPAPGEPDPDCLDFEVDHRLFEERIWPGLAARVPAFAAIRLRSSWAGHYDLNTFDYNAILGPHPRVGNFLFANGFSGHGLQQGPAVGRALMELVVQGRYVSLDLSRFGFGRLIRGERVLERNVV